MVDVEKNPRDNMVAALLGLHAQTACTPVRGPHWGPSTCQCRGSGIPNGPRSLARRSRGSSATRAGSKSGTGTARRETRLTRILT